MLSDNIRNYRKKNNLSQDQLAEKVGVSRQSVSFWENGQTQPTIDNIIALARIFNISADMLLSDGDTAPNIQDETPEMPINKKKSKKGLVVVICIIIVMAMGISMAIFGKDLIAYLDNLHSSFNNDSISQTESLEEEVPSNTDTAEKTDTTSENKTPVKTQAPAKAENSANTSSGNSANTSSGNSVGGNNSTLDNTPSTPAQTTFDLFTYCKNFAIEKGELNGDYCIYQQPSKKYGGYDNEYFSISYWADSDMVEFCLHCPLDGTYSHNFYLRMRGGYNKKYEYLSSKYYRNSGESLRSATGYIDPTVFSSSYPISCDKYDGSLDGQNQFMEDTRVGMCDLIRCLKEFVKVENMNCDFSAFDFVNF